MYYSDQHIISRYVLDIKRQLSRCFSWFLINPAGKKTFIFLQYREAETEVIYLWELCKNSSILNQLGFIFLDMIVCRS